MLRPECKGLILLLLSFSSLFPALSSQALFNLSEFQLTRRSVQSEQRQVKMEEPECNKLDIIKTEILSR